MNNESKSISDSEIEDIQKKLSQICNDPDMIIPNWCHTFCLKCNNFVSGCKCSDQPWNLPFEEQQEYLKNENQEYLKNHE